MYIQELIKLRRGVKGISYEWEHCIDGNCGHSEIDDIIASTKHILNLYQHIDIKRVTLYGSSYGGFISLLIAGKHNHTAIFSRIVSHCGVFDLSTYPDECLGKRKEVMLGYTNCCEESEYNTKIADISPNHFVDSWNVAIWLIHAIDDTTVWFG